ncbi:hypothetical protein [Micromonospora globbae]|uniref:Uncharacterized protein n=1 Tax=Micromonospora globbae TaxID=1894969 RepID=A0A420F8K9_9ACTN|nr:hypothetical protein [Micromonospora globbae]RKF29231.1 hypothetical protein D7I43_01285 [Micromonospora globbae]
MARTAPVPDVRARFAAGAPGRRPLTRAAVGGLAAHVFFELGAGVGMPLASVVGPYPAATAWGLGTAAVWRAAGRPSPSADRLLAAANGFGLAAVVAHLAGWPTRTRFGVPWLRTCEGLGPDLMRYYNPIIYVSGAACLLAILRENRTAPVALPALMLGLAPALVAMQHAEHRRLKARARRRRAWWNRRL